MSIKSENTTCTNLASNLNKTGSWQFTLENDQKNQRTISKKKYIGYTILLLSLIIWSCLFTYLMSEVTRLKELEHSISDKLDTNVMSLQSLIKQSNEASNEVQIKTSHLEILVNMQSNLISRINAKIDTLKGQIKFNNLRNDHLEKTLYKIIEREEIEEQKVIETQINNQRDDISNVTMHEFRNEVLSLIRDSKEESLFSIMTFENLTYDRIDHFRQKLEEVSRTVNQMSITFDKWQLTEDERSSILNLKNTIDKLKYSVTRKYSIL